MQISLHSAKLAINFTAKIGKSGKYCFFFFFLKKIVNPSSQLTQIRKDIDVSMAT